MENLPVDNIIDTPDKRDYPFEEWAEYADGTELKRPRRHVIMFSQLKTLMCTRFGLDIICRANDILEDIQNTDYPEREQLNPFDRYDDDADHRLSTRLNEFKEEGRIEGYVSISKRLPKEERNKQLQQALTRGFVYTGTDYVGWTIPQKPLLSFRKDKLSGHAFAIVDYVNGVYTIANSFGTGRGDGGYGYIKEDDVDKLFTCYQIIDKSDTEYFKNFKIIQKAKQGLANFKGVYGQGNEEVDRYLESIQLTKTLEEILGFKY